MKRLNEEEIKEMSNALSFTIKETKEIAEIFYREKEKGNFRLTLTNLDTVTDYINEYETSWYRYSNWEELLKSEEEQTEGLTAEECETLKNVSIFRLSSGKYIETVF